MDQPLANAAKGAVKPIISFRNITKRWGSTVAVDNVSLDIMHSRRLAAVLRLRSDYPRREDDAERPDHKLILHKCGNVASARRAARCSYCGNERVDADECPASTRPR